MGVRILLVVGLMLGFQRCECSLNTGAFSGKNYAMGKNATQGPGTLNYYIAALAVDGNKDTNQDITKSCSHTAGSPSYWAVELGLPLYITGIIIYNRYTLYLRDRLQNFKIYGLTRFGEEVIYDDKDEGKYQLEVIRIVISASKTYTSIKIWIPGDYLTLCEVEVYGVPGCELPTPTSHLRITSSTNYTVGSSITLACTTGYSSLEDNKTITCNSDSEWSEELPICNPIPCQPPETLENGRYFVSNRNECASDDLNGLYYLCKIKADCNEGYRLQNQSERTCQDNGQWTTEYPMCNTVTCRLPEDFAHGKYVNYTMNNAVSAPETLIYETKIEIECETGYKMDGHTERFCTSNGTWSGDDPNCTIVKCSFQELGTIANGHYILNVQNESHTGVANYMETVRAVCTKGFMSESNINSTCTADGTWSRPEASCKIVTCLTPSDTPYIKYRTWYNESFGNYTTALPFGAFYEVTCHDGILKSGSIIRNCTEAGAWDGDEAVCVSLCRAPEETNAMFRDNNNVFLDVYEEGQNLSFTCNEGYTSTIGQVNITCQKDHLWNNLHVCSQLSGNISTTDSHMAVIIGLSCGLVICAVAAIAAFLVYILRWKRKKRQEEDLYTRLHTQQASNVENEYAKIQETTVK